VAGLLLDARQQAVVALGVALTLGAISGGAATAQSTPPPQPPDILGPIGQAQP
jgi:hypothetical protein